VKEHRADSRGIRRFSGDGFVLECVCSHPFGLSKTPDAAARAWVEHVRLDAAREALSALRYRTPSWHAQELLRTADAVNGAQG